jgi:valyl-tRNA synthetase
VAGVEIYVKLAGLIDREKELTRLNKEHEKLTLELEKIRARLAEEKFLTKATAESISKEQARAQEFSAKIELITERLRNLGEL